MSNPILLGIQSFFARHSIHTNETLIVGVSGGLDSMVLLHACIACGMRVVVAHVNYGFRGEESMADEAFVKNYCQQQSIPCETRAVTQEQRQEHEGSTQEWARQLRYEWFNALKDKHAARYILVAHHANDQTETMLLQFIRGGAGKSVYGMAEASGAVLRPLLSMTKSAILNYAKSNGISWRNDSSNETDIYTRNLLRHHLLPQIEQINPRIHDTILQRSAIMHEEQVLVDTAVQHFLKEQMTAHEGFQSLPIASLAATRAEHVVLWRWLNPFGFTSGQIYQIAEMCGDAGRAESARCSSATHDVFVQRGMVNCVEREMSAESSTIQKFPATLGRLNFSVCTPQEVSFTADRERQYLDADKVDLPICVRRWKAGDRFLPLGAPGNQKVADFLPHAHIPAWEKERIQVLEANGKVIAVLGWRIDEAFKITAATRQCVCITFGGFQS